MPPVSTSSRTLSTKVTTKTNDIDDLSRKLGSKLVISDHKGKQKASAGQTSEDKRNDAMRMINSHSQSFTVLMQSGWKASENKRLSNGKQQSITSVKSQAVAVRTSLQLLRSLSPHDSDIERAASSLVGKLTLLEFHDHALDILVDMHEHLLSLYPHEPLQKIEQLKTMTAPPDKFTQREHILSLPLPSGVLDVSLLKLLSTYLLHSLTAFTSAGNIDLEHLANILTQSVTLNTWIPTCSSLPTDHIDSICTRAYTALTRFVGSSSRSTPRAILDIRFYSIRCLLHASSSTISQDTFWDQVTKFAILFIKGNRNDETSLSQIILTAFSRLVDDAQQRSDKDSFLSGKGFVKFCEYWMGFAKKNGDITTLERISSLISGVRSCSTSLNIEDQSAIDAAKVCADLAQVTAALNHSASSPAEEQHDFILNRLSEVGTIFERCVPFLTPSVREKDCQGNRKVGRAYETLRRTIIKLLETSNSSRLVSHVRTLLECLITVLESSVSQTGTEDLRSSTLDTLFVLARNLLDASNPDTYIPVYNTLERATRIARSEPHPSNSLPNYLRCVSAAYYAIGGGLYQAGRYGAAVRFLQEACTIGNEAVTIWRRSSDTTDTQIVQEAWKQLEEQRHKRWELLGVCHSKIADRLRACDAFVQCIRCYPFETESFTSLLSSVTPQSIFDAPQHNHIGAIIDRVTFMGVSDLFRAPSQVSLKDIMYPLCETYGDVIVGAILEKQIDGLEGSNWKESVRNLVIKLLEDALEVYGDRWPIRRVRVLLRCLEFSYHATPGTYNWNPEDILKQTENLLGRESFGEDSQCSHFKSQYLASAHLWMTLHAHRRGHSQHEITEHAEEACKILRSLLTSATRSPQTKKIPKASAAKSAPAKSRPVRKPRKPLVTTKQPKVLPAVSPNDSLRTPPRISLGGASSTKLVPFDQLRRLASLLQMTAQLLGLLGHVLAKVHLLTVTRRLMEHNAETCTDDYVQISIDLAHEYVKLGRMERASLVYGQTISTARNSHISEETRVFLFLRFAESSAMIGNVLQSATMYCEAQALSEMITAEDKGASTASRVSSRIGFLERAAMAANAFAMIQYYNDDPTTSLNALLQSLRLYNRAVETFARLNPVPASQRTIQEDDPFAAPEAKDADKLESQLKPPHRKAPMNGLEWRICEGLLMTLFALAQAYFARGSVREAEYFAQQAQDLAESINTPAMVSRALARKGEIYLHLGQLDEGYQCIVKAAGLVSGISATDAADIRRLHGEYSQRSLNNEDAQQLYGQAMAMLEDLQKMFLALDGVSPSLRTSDVRSPRTSRVGSENDTLLPSLLASVLRQHIWLLRDEDTTGKSKALLSKFHALPASAETKAGENGLMAKLALHDAYTRFRADMFLSSLAESTIALPMGMTGSKILAHTPSTQDILTILMNAEKLFWSDLALITRRGHVSQIREAAISLALIRAFQTSLGKAGLEGPILTVQLLDASTAITLRREMLEAIRFKFPDILAYDDLQWPMLTRNGSPLSLPKRKDQRKVGCLDLADDDDVNADDAYYKQYWEDIAKRYVSPTLDAKTLSTSPAGRLPENWTVINISVTEDKSTMFISRQRAQRQPIIFCVPLKGRREGEADEHLTFDDAIKEFNEIIHLNDEATKRAAHLNKNDKRARSDWWAERSALDTRLQELLENIEFCWLGAFKTILSETMNILDSFLSSFRSRLEGVFQRGLVALDKKQLGQVQLDDGLLECLATLSPKCRDEELEDLVYFILDLYQFHGIPVAIAEVDVDQLVIDLRNMLEEHAMCTMGQTAPQTDNHTFLILDKNVEGLPWESIPVLRGKSVSRIPNMDFLLDRLDLATRQRQKYRLFGDDNPGTIVDRIIVDPRKTFYALNPSGDLKGTEGRFSDWLVEMKSTGWRGLISRPPSEQQFLDALSTQDLVLYFGHGGGEQYVRSHKIRHLHKCAATMLWGCSSGSMKDMGEFDRVGTPYNYMAAGCPTLVANIWDVTDRDIDKFAQSVFDKMGMTKENISRWSGDVETGKTSLVTAVAQSRDSCKLKYLTGAAPIVYGIPFYL